MGRARIGPRRTPARCCARRPPPSTALARIGSYLDKLTRNLQGSKKDFREVIVVHNCKEVIDEDTLRHVWETQAANALATRADGFNRQRRRIQRVHLSVPTGLTASAPRRHR